MPSIRHLPTLLLLVAVTGLSASETASLPLSLLTRAMDVAAANDCELRLNISSDSGQAFMAWIERDGNRVDLTTEPVTSLHLADEVLRANAGGTLATDQPKGSMNLTYDVGSRATRWRVAKLATYAHLYRAAEANVLGAQRAADAITALIPPGMEPTVPQFDGIILRGLQGTEVTLVFADGRKVVFHPDEDGSVIIPAIESWLLQNPTFFVPGMDHVTL